MHYQSVNGRRALLLDFSRLSENRSTARCSSPWAHQPKLNLKQRFDPIMQMWCRCCFHYRLISRFFFFFFNKMSENCEKWLSANTKTLIKTPEKLLFLMRRNNETMNSFFIYELQFLFELREKWSLCQWIICRRLQTHLSRRPVR